MNRVNQTFERLSQASRKALMPFVCAGHPAIDSLPEVLSGCERGGASIIEVGIPFSDPIADGPVIAAAMHEALRSGITPGRVFEQVAAARASVEAALVAMVSVSIVSRMGGPLGFVREAVAAGFDGFIFPDAPLEESGPLIDAARECGATLSLLVAPTTRVERVSQIATASTGFVYVLARAGLTGERGDAPNVGGLVQAVRRATSTPIVCGFGVSTPEQARHVAAHADGVIVGSALVRRLAEAAQQGEEPGAAAERIVRSFVDGVA